MASYSVQTAKHATLTAATVDDVTFAGVGSAIQIVHRGAVANPLYVTTGKTAALTTNPTSAGDNTYVVVSGAPLILPYPLEAGGGGCAIKLISAGAEAYSVQLLFDRNGV